MEGCPLSRNKFQGNCATCAQVEDCVFLGILKKLDEVRAELRDVQRRVKGMQSS